MDQADKKVHINFWYVIAAVLGMLLIQDLYLESTKLTIPWNATSVRWNCATKPV